jgi:hypothetical protein
MARSFLSTMVQIAREQERAGRARIRETERRQHAIEREARAKDKLSRESYAASREAEAQSENDRIKEHISELEAILGSRLGQDPTFDFKSLFRIPSEQELTTIGR